VVLVTGASSGIGEAISREFAAHGMNVVLTARRAENLQRITKEIEKKGGSVLAVSVDVTSEDDQKHAFKLAEEKFGAIHFVVANAGYGGGTGDFFATETSIEDARQVFNVNVIGVLITLREGVKALRKAGGGAIVTISSPGGTLPIAETSRSTPTPFGLTYCPSKSAVDQIARSAAGLVKENIRVYNVSPFVFRTDMAEKGIHTGLFPGITSLEQLSGFLNPVFPGKVGDPAVLAKVILPMFDNSTAWAPGTLVCCDNDATFSGHARQNQLEKSQLAVISRDEARDATGHKHYFQ